jgi:hypothetical protein
VIEIVSDPAVTPDSPQLAPSPARTFISAAEPSEMSPPVEQPPIDNYQSQIRGG